MTQHAQAPQENVHPFDMDKSDFEKLLEKDFNLKSIESSVQDAADAMMMDHMHRAVYLARAQDRLRRELDPMQWIIEPLMGTRLGFKTDKKVVQSPNGVIYPYPWEITRDCVLEALMAGANLVGNEFNVIAGNPYLTREFFYRKINELVSKGDLTDFLECPSVPRVQGNSAVVLYNAKGAYKGRPFDYTREIPIRVNEGQGPDAILGKAQRKFFKWLLETLLRINFMPDAEAAEGEVSAYTAPTNGSRVAEVQTATAQAQQPKREAPPAPKPQGTTPAAARPGSTAKPAGRPVATPPAPVQEAPAPVEADPRTPDDIAWELVENTADNDILPAIQAYPPAALEKAKRVAKKQGPVDEFQVEEQRQVYFFLKLAELKTPKQ